MSMRSAVMAAAGAALCVAAGAAAEVQPPTGAEAGKIVFRKICVSCHGSDARGGGPAAESLKVKPADLRLIAKRRNGTFPEDEIKQHIDGRKAPAAHGTRDMPVWGDYVAALAPDTEREPRREQLFDAVVAYLKTIQE
jgi:mono/diheme cytochrome c family protein